MKKSPYPEIEQEHEEEGTKGSTDETNDREFEPMPHLADGGIADFDVNTGDSDTLKGMPINPAAVPPQVASGQANPAPAAPAPATMAAPTALQAKAANPRPLPGMPADVTADELEGYLNKQRSSIEKYNPDRQYDQEMSMLKTRTGLPMSLAHAGSTFADALMQGVARAGNPGFEQNLENREKEIGDEATGALERARKGTMEQVEAEQKIDMQDPKSSISNAYQQTFGPIFAKMGYNPADVSKMNAAQIGTAADLGVRYADAQTQMELKKAMLQVQTLTAMATMQNQKAERVADAAKTLEGRGLFKRGLDYVTGNPATTALEKELQGGTTGFAPDELKFAKMHNLSPEQAKAILDKRKGAQ